MKPNANGSDPKLLAAMEEFKALCKKYDCMASVVLVSPTHSEFLYQVEASWSVIKLVGNEGMRFRSKKEDFPNREAQNFATNSTVHALTSFSEYGRKSFADIRTVLSQLSKHMTTIWETWE